jgi:hypothetical protein
MAHAQKPDFVFSRNGLLHLNRRGRQFSRLLAGGVCASAVVMLVTLCSEVVWEYWLPTPFASFPFTSPPVRHRVPSGFKRTLPSMTAVYLASGTICFGSGLGDEIYDPHTCTVSFRMIRFRKPWGNWMAADWIAGGFDSWLEHFPWGMSIGVFEIILFRRVQEYS